MKWICYSTKPTRGYKPPVWAARQRLRASRPSSYWEIPEPRKPAPFCSAGLEPELLAGQVYQGDAVAPTRSLNLWFARQWLVIDPAGGLLADRASRQATAA